MYNLEPEKKYKSQANSVVFLCTAVLCFFMVIIAFLEGKFFPAKIFAGIAILSIVAFYFGKNKKIKDAPFAFPFIAYVVCVGAAFTVDNFTYFYCFYLLIIAAGATYFKLKKFFHLIVATNIINFILSILSVMGVSFLPALMHSNSLLHFFPTLGVSVIMYFVVRFSIDRINNVSSTIASFSALMKVAPNVLILVDEENKIKYLSQSVRKVLGIENYMAFIGRNFLELFNESSVRELFVEITKKGIFYEEYQKINVNGVTKTFDISADKMSDKNNVGMFFMLNDVSEIIRLKELAEQDSLMDSLVQIPNRRAFDRQISQEWERSLRDEFNVSFLMIDIDLFKNYNDTYGHRQGDELLKTAGELFKRSLKRSTDFVARIGGEEFGVILHATNAYQAEVTAERIRKTIEEAVILTANGKKTKFTVSIGVCTLIPQKGLEYGTLIEEADKALYKAKKKGRNQVCVAEVQ